MRIENGFARFNIDEKIDVDLIQIKYTKQNHRPLQFVIVVNNVSMSTLRIVTLSLNLEGIRYIVLVLMMLVSVMLNCQSFNISLGISVMKL